MAFKFDNKIVFTVEGVVLAIDNCNSGPFAKCYYLSQGNRLDISVIEDIIAKKKAMHKEIVYAVRDAVLKKLVAQVATDASGNVSPGIGNTTADDLDSIQQASDSDIDDDAEDTQDDCDNAARLAKTQFENNRAKQMFESELENEKQRAENKFRIDQDIKDRELEADMQRDETRQENSRALKRKQMEDDPLMQVEYELRLIEATNALTRARRDKEELTRRAAEEEVARNVRVLRPRKTAAK
jgi:hypothetical protein